MISFIEPKNIDEALDEFWTDALDEDMEQIIWRQVWDLVPQLDLQEQNR